MYAPLLARGAMFLPPAMEPDTRKPPTGPFEEYQALIQVVASWDTLAGLAERIYQDPRLRPRDRDRLLAVVSSREPWIRPDWVQPTNG